MAPILLMKIDPFETDTAAESGDTGLTSSGRADVNDSFETDAAAESGDTEIDFPLTGLMSRKVFLILP